MTVPVDAKRLDWPRLVAENVNRSVKRDGQTIYTAPTISDPPTQAEVQALADAVAALSERLK
ncbi:hypothetical protein [Croceicoccus sp. Ery15]|uniref:hypothetical protein n=1 Tax=Croceicoccus sp. Ery15 TaxID=1703338 RepID=UPI001E63EAFD|nr:hypothetical protein [Croceicoccus sp. Ery15]